jgi:ABC-2 type transport system permease protein
MSNILAIAEKELRAYFASPIAYVVIGLFAFIFGYFYIAWLDQFIRHSMQMAQFGGPGSFNINQQMIRPMLYNATVVLLFVIPMITMRTYSEEKKMGTIELLLTSPLTDFQIIMGKFIGAMGLYASMLGVSALYIALLFAYGNPELLPVLTAYLGLLLLGGCFIAIGLLVSSFTRNQIVAAFATFIIVLLLWVIDWIGTFAGPTVEKIVSALSVVNRFEDFTKGVIDTGDVVYYLSFITFGLFLTAKSVDRERWQG